MKRIALFAIIILLVSDIAFAGRVKEDLQQIIATSAPDAQLSVLVEFEKRPGAAEKAALKEYMQAQNSKLKDEYECIDWAPAEVSAKAVSGIAELPNVKEITPDYVATGELDVSVPLIKAPEVIAKGATGAGVKVAVLDSGVDSRPELTIGKQVDMTGEGAGDFQGHGTHVAGIVAAKKAGTTTFNGVAPGAEVYDVKVLRKEVRTNPTTGQQYTVATGPISGIINGIEWALNNGADILSMSLGAQITPCDGSDALSRAVDNAVDAGKIVVVSAGNSGPNAGTIGAPGCAKKSIAVGATDDNDQIARFSSRGPTTDGRVKPDIVAPSVGITSLKFDSTTDLLIMSGTSQAAPHVAGIAALMKSKDPTLDQMRFLNALKSTARNLGLDPNTQGAGRVDTLAVYDFLFPPAPTPPPSPPAPLADTSAPTCIINPPSPALTNDIMVSISGSTTDNTETTTVTCEGTAAALTGTGTTKSFTATVGLTIGDGRNTIACTAKDAAGNTGTCTQTVTLDTTPPTMFCPASQPATSSPFTAAGTASDTGGSGIKSVMLGSTAATFSAGAWSASLPLVTGANSFTAVATDNAGNTNQCSFTITMQAPPAVLEGKNFAEASTIITTKCALAAERPNSNIFSCLKSAVAEPTRAFCVEQDAGNVPNTHGQLLFFQPQVATADTFNAFIEKDFCLSTTALNEKACKTDGTVDNIRHDCQCSEGRCTGALLPADTSPPTCTILMQQPLFTTGTSMGIFFSRTSDDTETTSVSCNGVSATLEGSGKDKTFSTPATIPLSEGPNPISCIAKDAANNAGTCTATIVRDTTPPVITCQTGQTVTSSPFAATGTVSDANSVTVSVGTTTASVAGNTWSASLPLVTGANSFTAEAADPAGNKQSCTFTITLQPPTPPPAAPPAPPTPPADTTAPTCLNGIPQFVAATAVSIFNITRDDVQTTRVTCNNVAATLGAGTQTRTFSAVNIPLTEGPNTITCTATDAAGNTGTCTSTTTRDTILPEIACPASQTVTSSPFQATSTTSDAGGIKSVLVGGTFATLSPNAWSAALQLQQGANQFTATATDNSGNTRQCGFTITLSLPAAPAPTPPTPAVTIPPPKVITILANGKCFPAANNIMEGQTVRWQNLRTVRRNIILTPTKIVGQTQQISVPARGTLDVVFDAAKLQTVGQLIIGQRDGRTVRFTNVGTNCNSPTGATTSIVVYPPNLFVELFGTVQPAPVPPTPPAPTPTPPAPTPPAVIPPPAAPPAPVLAGPELSSITQAACITPCRRIDFAVQQITPHVLAAPVVRIGCQTISRISDVTPTHPASVPTCCCPPTGIPASLTFPNFFKSTSRIACRSAGCASRSIALSMLQGALVPADLGCTDIGGITISEPQQGTVYGEYCCCRAGTQVPLPFIGNPQPLSKGTETPLTVQQSTVLDRIIGTEFFTNCVNKQGGVCVSAPPANLFIDVETAGQAHGTVQSADDVHFLFHTGGPAPNIQRFRYDTLDFSIGAPITGSPPVRKQQIRLAKVSKSFDQVTYEDCIAAIAQSPNQGIGGSLPGTRINVGSRILLPYTACILSETGVVAKFSNPAVTLQTTRRCDQPTDINDPACTSIGLGNERVSVTFDIQAARLSVSGVAVLTGAITGITGFAAADLPQQTTQQQTLIDSLEQAEKHLESAAGISKKEKRELPQFFQQIKDALAQAELIIEQAKQQTVTAQFTDALAQALEFTRKAKARFDEEQKTLRCTATITADLLRAQQQLKKAAAEVKTLPTPPPAIVPDTRMLEAKRKLEEAQRLLEQKKSELMAAQIKLKQAEHEKKKAEQSLEDVKQVTAPAVPLTAPVPAPQCTDSDGGKDSYVKGIAYGSLTPFGTKYENKVGQSEDTCLQLKNGQYPWNYDLVGWESRNWHTDSGVFNCEKDCAAYEKYCADTRQVAADAINCPNGCKDGACLKEPAPTPPPTPPPAPQPTPPAPAADTTRPQCTISGQSGRFESAQTVTISGTTTDNIETTSVDCSLRFATNPPLSLGQATLAGTGQSKTFTMTVFLGGEGSNIITCMPRDAAGNTGSVCGIEIKKDTMPPTIRCPPPQTVTSSPFTATGSASDTNGISSVMVGTTVATVTQVGTNFQWSASLPLNAGQNTFTATATDNSEKTGQCSFMITFQPPQQQQYAPPSSLCNPGYRILTCPARTLDGRTITSECGCRPQAAYCLPPYPGMSPCPAI